MEKQQYGRNGRYGRDNGNRSGNVTYEIVEAIGVIDERDSGWRRELNIVSWNGQKPKFDIRDWNEEHTKLSRGITLKREELEQLIALYEAYRDKEEE